MSTVSVARRASRRYAQGGNGDKVVVNLDVSSPVVGSRDGASISSGAHASRGSNSEPGSRSRSPIDVEALDDEVQAVSPSRVPPQRSQTTRRQPVTVVIDEDLELHTRQEGVSQVDAANTFAVSTGNKRRRVPPVIHCLSPDREEGSSFQPNNVVKINTEPAKVTPKEPSFTCPVCLNKLDEPSATICGHIFCARCIKASIQAQKKCPTCRRKLRMNNFHRVYLPDTTD